MTMQSTLIPEKQKEKGFYEAIIDDIKKVPILLLSERGHGKSTALKTIIKKCKEEDKGINIKIFDTSMSWYKSSPTKYRQLVTADKLIKGEIKNIGDCVYEIGLLTEAERRVFIGLIIAQDYRKSYHLKLNDDKAFEKLDWVVYLLEEANTYFSSNSFRLKDNISQILIDFISVGRNYKLSAFLVSTAEDGEISPSLRRRARRIYGRLVAEGDIRRVKQKDKAMAQYLEKEIPRFNFVYWGDEFIGPVRIPDEVKTPAADLEVEATQPSTWWPRFWIGFFGALAAFYLLLRYFGIF